MKREKKNKSEGDKDKKLVKVVKSLKTVRPIKAAKLTEKKLPKQLHMGKTEKFEKQNEIKQLFEKVIKEDKDINLEKEAIKFLERNQIVCVPTSELNGDLIVSKIAKNNEGENCAFPINFNTVAHDENSGATVSSKLNVRLTETKPITIAGLFLLGNFDALFYGNSLLILEGTEKLKKKLIKKGIKAPVPDLNVFLNEALKNLEEEEDEEPEEDFGTDKDLWCDD